MKGYILTTATGFGGISQCTNLKNLGVNLKFRKYWLWRKSEILFIAFQSQPSEYVSTHTSRNEESLPNMWRKRFAVWALRRAFASGWDGYRSHFKVDRKCTSFNLSREPCLGCPPLAHLVNHHWLIICQMIWQEYMSIKRCWSIYSPGVGEFFLLETYDNRVKTIEKKKGNIAVKKGDCR